jgi:hypothetical protein
MLSISAARFLASNSDKRPAQEGGLLVEPGVEVAIIKSDVGYIGHLTVILPETRQVRKRPAN